MKKTIQILVSLAGGGITAIALLFIAGYFDLIEFYQPFIVQSGSMEPAIKTGSVVFVLPNTFGYSVGDIITFNQNRNQITTHRIVELLQDGDQIIYRTQGDANEEPDHSTVSRDQIIGRVALSLPFIGYLGQLAQKPQGFILLVIVPATIIIYEELRRLVSEIKTQAKLLWQKLRPPNTSPPTPASASQPALTAPPKQKPIKSAMSTKNSPFGFPVNPAIIIPILGGFFVVTSLTVAYFQDRETSANNVLGASNTWEVEAQPAAVSALPSPKTQPPATPTATVSATPLPSPSPTPNLPGSVVINEINWAGSNGDGNDEWVELYNTTNTDINLAGWSIENLGAGGPKATITIPSGVIPAQGFFLISHSPKNNSAINIDPNFVTTLTQLLNGGEQLILWDDANNVIDIAGQDGPWFAGSGATPKRSMERVTPFSVGTVAASWQSATTRTNMDGTLPTDEFATPKATNGI